MTPEKRTEILHRAVRTFGEYAQLDMVVEEMAELTKALCKYKRAVPGPTRAAIVENIEEEVADVQIMLDQLRIIIGRSGEEAEREKLERLERRLDRHEAAGRGEVDNYAEG